MDLRDDLKSMKSYKSRGSIKSEVQPEQNIDKNMDQRLKNINTLNNSKLEDSEDDSEQSSHLNRQEGADIISHKSYKSIKSMQQKNKTKHTQSIIVRDDSQEGHDLELQEL